MSRQLPRKMLAAVVAACFGAAQAHPVAPQVAAGQASFNQQGNLFSITNTPNTIINWQSFSIGANEVTRFIQQNGDSKVLNRITGQDPSQILGALQSNGKVFLINPNGVLFGAGARVDVNGLVASSLNISNADFLAGKNNYTGGAGAGRVDNQGAITTPDGGQVFLIAPNVANSGIIMAPNGQIILAAGESVQLVDSAHPDVQVRISAPADQALNLGRIVAQGGSVGIYGALVNQRGHVSADSAVRGDAGQIILKASGTMLLETGSTTTATGAGGKGGTIELLGQQVGLTGNASVDASGASGGGTVLVGGDYHGLNPALPNAQFSYVGADAVIAADALQSGAGGKVIVWADQATRAHGSISARGGAQGGDGGFIETSGAYLDVAGIRAGTAAAHGKLGQWLLDPDDIVVATGGSAELPDVTTFGAGSGTSTIDPLAFRDSADTVVLQARNSIAFNSPVAMSYLGAGLSAQAGGDIAVHATIGTNSGPVSLSANDSGGSALGVGMVHVYGGGAIDTRSGSSGGAAITLSGAAVTAGDGLNAGGGAITLSATGGGTPASGKISAGALSADTATLTASNDITFNGPVNLAHSSGTALTAYAGNNITLGAGSGITTAGGGVTLFATGALAVGAGSGGISTDGGAALLYGASVLLADNVDAGTGQMTVQSNVAGDAITVNAGVTLSSGGAELQADSMALNGTVHSSGNVMIGTFSDATAIHLGAGATSGAGVLGLSDSALHNISAGQIVVGARPGGYSGTVSVTGALNLTGGAGLQVLAGSIAVHAPLTVAQNVYLTSNAANGAITVDAGATVSASDIQLMADSMALNGHVNSPGRVMLYTFSNGTAINLGHNAVNGTGVLGLSDTALRNIGSPLIGIGNREGYTGALTVTGALNLTGSAAASAQLQLGGGSIAIHAPLTVAQNVDLLAGGAVTENGGGTITAPQLSFLGGTVTLGGANRVGKLAGVAAGDALFTDAGSGNLLLGDVDGKSGVRADGHTVTLNAGGNISQNNYGYLIASKVVLNTPGSVDLTEAGGTNQIGVLEAQSIGSLSLAQMMMPVTLGGDGKGVTLKSGGGSGRAITVTDSAGITVAQAVNGNGAPVSLSGGNIFIGNELTPSSASVGGSVVGLMASGSLTMAGGASVSASGTLNMVADTMTLPTAAAISAPAVFIAPYTGGRAVRLGGSDGGDLNVSPDALAAMSSANIAITSTAGVTVAQAVTLPGVALSLDGGTAGIWVDAALSARTLRLTADQMGFSDILSADLANFTNASPNLPIRVGYVDGACSPSCLALNDLSFVHVPVIGIGTFSGDAASGAITVAGFDAGVHPLTSGPPPATITTIGLLTHAGITQTGPIVVSKLGVQAGGTVLLDNSDNAIDSVAALLTAGDFTLASGNALAVTRLKGGDPVAGLLYDVNGISTPGNVTLTSAGAITRSATGAADAGIKAATLTLVAGNGIGAAGAPLMTSVVTLDATNEIGVNGASPINISNTDQNGGTTQMTVARAWQSADGGALNSGPITIENTGAMLVGEGNGVRTDSGAITLHTHSPLTIDGPVSSTNAHGGVITLSAGPSGSDDTLTIANGNLVTTTGAIALNAGGDIVVNGASVAGNVTTTGNQNAPPPPDLPTCIANPSAAGCAAVLPTLNSCVVNPTLAGCSVVLPTLASCAVNPTANGCSVVLPTLGSCTANPTAAGCSVVLPSLASCTANPTAAGCSVVLPTLASCSVNPTAAGCSVVLPSLASCTANPGAAGCSVVLPSLASCTANPTAAGCSAVLPALDACIANPTAPGCTAVLPPVSACVSNPSAAGCSAVLPSLAVCTTNPSTAGCSVVLPTLAACTVNPSAAGCSTVLPSLAVCTVNPSASGCSAVLPTLAVCTVNPSAVGCSAVLPSLAACTVNPLATGCSAVLPSLSSCTAASTLAGCSVVLPTLATCVAHPSAAGCGIVLPSLAQCSSTPSLAGCSAVLPTVAQCTVTPTAAGCASVLPSLAQCTATPSLAGCTTMLPPTDICAIAPNSALCQVLIPPVASQPTPNAPLTVALNQTVQLVNSTAPSTILNVVPPTPSTGGSGGNNGSNGSAGSSGGNSSTSSTPDDKVADKSTAPTSTNPGVANEPAKKMYCN